MRGHTQLIAMRKDGLVPDVVLVETNPELFTAVHDWHEYSPTRAQVRIEATDNPDAADLRFLVGLSVMVNGNDLDRVRRVGKACERAKASRVITFVQRAINDRFEIVEMTDTAGRVTWQKS